MKYDESDNIMVRLSRNVTDKVGDAFSGVLTQSDMSETLAEIRKLDPNFDKETFIRECRYEIIPTVLEAFLQGKDDILKDWCHEAAYNVLSAIIKQKSTNAATSKVLEVQNVDILGAKVLEQGPVMILTFTAQQLTFDDTSNENRSLTKV
jgi:import inner membrane translocase subunit TIM44